jgi:hypothetical protein
LGNLQLEKNNKFEPKKNKKKTGDKILKMGILGLN